MKQIISGIFFRIGVLFIILHQLSAQPADKNHSAKSEGRSVMDAKATLTANNLSITPAEYGVFYAVVNSSAYAPDGLISINPATGSASLLGVTNAAFDLSGLAINSGGEMFGTDGYTGKLYRIDAATGEVYFTVDTGLKSLNAVAFDRDHSLYAISNYNIELYRINPVTGAATSIGLLPYRFAELAVDPTDGTLWASQYDGGLFIIDPEKASAKFFGSVWYDAMTTLEFDNWGNLFCTMGEISGSLLPACLYTIDETTAARTLIGDTGFREIAALAARPGILAGRHICILPAKLVFERIPAGDMSSYKTITLRSVGTDTLAVSGMTPIASPFQAITFPTTPFSLPPGHAITFSVAFAPSLAGEYSSTCVISSDAVDNNSRTIELIGKAKAPAPPGAALYAINADSREIVQIDPITFLILNSFAGPEPNSPFDGDMAYNGKNLFFSKHSTIYLLDPLTGQVRQSIPMPIDNSSTGQTHSGSSLYGVHENQTIVEIDPATGIILNKIEPFIDVTGDIVFSGDRGTLFASTVDGRISELNASTGAKINSFDFPYDILHFLAYSNHLQLLFAYSSEAKIYMLNPDNGIAVDSCWAPLYMSTLCADEYRVQTGAIMDLGPREIDFGKRILGHQSPPKKVLFRSIGTDTVVANDVEAPKKPFELESLPPLPLVIPPQSYAVATVTFSPNKLGSVEATLAATCAGINDPIKSIIIRGEGVHPPATGTLFGSGMDNLLIINPETGSYQHIGTIKGVGLIGDIEFRSDGTLFGIAGSQATLFTINTPDGTPYIIADCCDKDGCVISALEFDAAGRLYGVRSYFTMPFRHTELVTINTGTGEISVIGSIDYFDHAMSGLAFGPDSTLYGVYAESNESYLITIDRLIGAGSLVGRIGFENVSALEFGPDSILYGAIGELGDYAGWLIKIDPTTGIGELLQPNGFSGITGLSFFPHYEFEPEPPDDVPSEFDLFPNYPNPFNLHTTIRYQLPEAAAVTLSIFNALGQKLKTLQRAETLNTGWHEVIWYGQSDAGLTVPSGIYVCRLEARHQSGVFVKKRKMCLVR